ncbi:MAG: hypothetical protein J0I12_30545 [Candidatus Eremiobacteraeota bacterium]|nr:hypothetical protein [Candidatus Eremiobacteraeota bacterium]
MEDSSDRAFDARTQDAFQTIDAGVGAFPESLSKGFAHALKASGQKIVEGKQAGRLSADEAHQSMEMLREVSGGLESLSSRTAQIVRATRYPCGNVKLYTIRGPEDDRFVVTTRARQDERGQARIGIVQIMNNGVEIPKPDQMHVRVDYDLERGVSIDVQFGLGDLNGKIHGYELDEQGDPLISQYGYKVVKHHFHEELPESLVQPGGFEEVVQSFVNGTLVQLPRG